jgi:threonine/homoserine/homoserine lactone efflux protein
MLLELALVLLILFGLAPLLSNQAVISSIGIIGGVVMGWMGVSMLRNCRSLSLDEARNGKATGLHPVIAGAVMSVANPYWTLWWATIGLTYVLTGLTFGAPGLIVFFVGHVLSDFVWYTIVSVAVARGSRVMSDRVYRSVIGLCGAAIILFGVFFTSSGIGFFAAS